MPLFQKNTIKGVFSRLQHFTVTPWPVKQLVNLNADIELAIIISCPTNFLISEIKKHQESNAFSLSSRLRPLICYQYQSGLGLGNSRGCGRISYKRIWNSGYVSGRKKHLVHGELELTSDIYRFGIV